MQQQYRYESLKETLSQKRVEGIVVPKRVYGTSETCTWYYHWYTRVSCFHRRFLLVGKIRTLATSLVWISEQISSQQEVRRLEGPPLETSPRYFFGYMYQCPAPVLYSTPSPSRNLPLWYVVLTFTRMITKSAVTGQAPVTLELSPARGKTNKPKVVHDIGYGVVRPYCSPPPP